MTTTLKARFDGNVLVPIGPVDLPQDRELEIEVKDATEPRRGSPELLLKIMREGPHVDAETIAEFNRAIEEGKIPARDEGIFDDLG